VHAANNSPRAVVVIDQFLGGTFESWDTQQPSDADARQMLAGSRYGWRGTRSEADRLIDAAGRHFDAALPEHERRSYAPTREQYDRIRCPVLGLFADDGAFVAARPAIAEVFRDKDAWVETWLSGSHQLHWDQPHAVADAITTFVELSSD
jgi:pimeloyl-ACP methyl ester carboxylesterase